MGVGADGSPDAVGQDAEERLLRQKYEQAMAEKRARQEAEFDAIMRQRDTIMHQSVDSARKSQEWRDSVKRTLSNGASQAQKRFELNKGLALRRTSLLRGTREMAKAPIDIRSAARTHTEAALRTLVASCASRGLRQRPASQPPKRSISHAIGLCRRALRDQLGRRPDQDLPERGSSHPTIVW